ncbi:uncharacterized protein BCR38DRAFT_432310 [Pseudomassariella vexata]|uniref:Cytochrome P450 n=1 Tax=Pseudomassariella vexata TaxID=1141098 RepID=A0A1Y2E167_9PEZI|nr:uncharacterized protein BCR38DRAFT_432310 [Pseudomassariella vexata]ORY65282.1 hypothetical protein BCR38DRAFT_432310 [Pseudomassariella vexata]
MAIECPTYAIKYDSDRFPEAENFRFHRLCKKAMSESADVSTQNQFVNVNQNSSAIGYGHHACPGRFFAGNEIKIIVVNKLLRCEPKLVEGLAAGMATRNLRSW